MIIDINYTIIAVVNAEVVYSSTLYGHSACSILGV